MSVPAEYNIPWEVESCVAECLSSVVLAAVVAIVAASSARAAESPSALLEKGIYTEETVGDLDAAAKLYEKAVAEAKQVEAVAAKAQYRLGLCLLKQGKKGARHRRSGSRSSGNIPIRRKLVAAARKRLPATPGLKLRPPMWGDGEVLHYRIPVGRRSGNRHGHLCGRAG